jgi:hypothetical protein
MAQRRDAGIVWKVVFFVIGFSATRHKLPTDFTEHLTPNQFHLLQKSNGKCLVATNPLQHRGLSHHRASDETCTHCNLITVPPLFSHPHLTPKCTHLRPTTPTIPFYSTIFCALLYKSSPIYMSSVLYTIYFVLYFCYCNRWGSHNA